LPFPDFGALDPGYACFDESKASIANKLARATMSAHFFLASLVAKGMEQFSLQDI
jgi:Domain of unknown function (DUF6471)